MSNIVEKVTDFNEELKFNGKLCPSAGSLFFLLDDDKLLFISATQQIYTLDALAAFIWCLLEDRRNPAEICQALAANGVDPRVAEEQLSAAIKQWLQIGAVYLDYSDVGTLPHSLTFEMVGFSVRMEFETESLKNSIALVFGDSTSERDSERELSGCILQILEKDGTACVLRDKASIILCPVFELAVCLKAYVIQRILDGRTGDIAFHSAMLVHLGKALLISGAPGEGKSTLAARLIEEGYEYAGDDVALITPNGETKGLPFPITLKSGSWNLINRFRPDLDSLAIHARPDSMRLRFLWPAKVTHEASPVAWCIFIRRIPAGDATIAPLRKSDALQRLMESSCAQGEKLTLESCLALRHMFTKADSFELVYSDLESAKEAIMSTCHA
jgi:hypothetical protein